MPNNYSALRCINTEEFFKGMGQQFVEIATGKFQGEAALVNGWEAQTAQAQANWGYSLAGMNTEQRAKAQGQWLGSSPVDASFHKGLKQNWGELAITARYENNSCLRKTHKGWRRISCVGLLVEPANSVCWRVEASKPIQIPLQIPPRDRSSACHRVITSQCDRHLSQSACACCELLTTTKALP